MKIYGTLSQIETELEDVIELIESEMEFGPMIKSSHNFLWEWKDQIQALYNRIGA